MSLSLGFNDPYISSLMIGCRLTVAFADEKLRFRESLRITACRGAALFLLSPCHGLRIFKTHVIISYALENDSQSRQDAITPFGARWPLDMPSFRMRRKRMIAAATAHCSVESSLNMMPYRSSAQIWDRTALLPQSGCRREPASSRKTRS